MAITRVRKPKKKKLRARTNGVINSNSAQKLFQRSIRKRTITKADLKGF